MVSIVFVSIMHAIGLGHDDTHASLFTRVDLWIALFTGVLPAWAATIHALSTAEDHERLAERSSRLVRLLTQLRSRIEAAEDLHELQTSIQEAEELFDLENQEWAESLADRRPVASG